MTLYRYIKAPSFPSPQTTSITFPQLILPSYLPLLLMAIGFLLISSVLSPIVYHELVIFPRLKKTSMISPLPTTVIQSQQLLQVAGVTTYEQPASLDRNNSSTQPDYTQVSNWFPTASISKPRPSRITHYNLDIPQLSIKNAVVEIGGNDLKQSLVQYAETANPGEFGSTVIFGHSVLRQFYNPSQSNPKRYISIFSTIMTLESGDRIYVNFDGINYTYQVTDKYEVKPEQVEVLQQRYDRQTLKLITCTPEGTYLRRGIIEAQLVPTYD